MQPTIPPATTQPASNRLWTFHIPIINGSTVLVCMGFLLLIDLPILLGSPDLKGYFDAMLFATSVLLFCALVELGVGRLLKDKPANGFDTAVVALVSARNAIAALNVIPLIQLLGMLASLLVIPLLIAEIILVVIRLTRARS